MGRHWQLQQGEVNATHGGRYVAELVLFCFDCAFIKLQWEYNYALQEPNA